MADPRSGPPALVIGLGNPVLGDDGVGWRVVDAFERRLADDALTRAAVGPVESDHLCVGGLSLMERVVGYERVVIADAVLGEGRAGTVWSRPLTAIATRRMGHLDSSHDASLGEAFAAGLALGVRLPDDVRVIGVAIERDDTFGESLSPAVERAVEPAATLVVAALADRVPEGR